jgi:hypothetical protein
VGLALAPEATIVSGVIAGMSLGYGVASVTIGLLQTGSAAPSDDATVSEALSTSAGYLSMVAEAVSAGLGLQSEDRAAARTLGETVQSGFELGKIGFRTSGFGSEPLTMKEHIANFVSVTSYLGGKLLFPEKPEHSHEGHPDRERGAPEPTHGPSVTIDISGEKIDLRPESARDRILERREETEREEIPFPDE